MVKHFLLALLLPSAVFTCGHEYLPPENLTLAYVEYEKSNGTRRDDPVWDWIRIKIEYDISFYELHEPEQELVKNLVKNAVDYFENTLKVRRLSAIQLSPKCEDKTLGRPNNGNVYCRYDCENRCGHVLATEQAYFKKCICTERPCRTRQRKWGGILRNADFVLFVSAEDSDACSRGAAAYATFCDVDLFTIRPIAGFVNICPRQLRDEKPDHFYVWESTIKHELMHALVFTPNLYEYFQAAKGPPPKEGKPKIVPGVFERFKRLEWETAKGYVSHDVYMIVSPKVKEEARRFFNCPDLEGAELESQDGRASTSGGRGSAFAHWEKRIFEASAPITDRSRIAVIASNTDSEVEIFSGFSNVFPQEEGMSAIITTYFAFSRITLALFEDSGWYQVNYNNADEMSFGRGLGCNFAKQSCLSWIKTNKDDPYPFCNVLYDTRCSANRMDKLRCNMVRGSKGLPAHFDYNALDVYKDKKGRPIQGHGLLAFADYCPYYSVTSTKVKEGSYDTKCTLPDNMNYNNYSLEIFSNSARCFELDGGIAVQREQNTDIWLHNVGCYETKCEEGLLFVKTQKSKFYPCYKRGQLVHVEKRLPGVGTVRTKIVCPSCAELCGEQFCEPERTVPQRIGDNSKQLFSSFIATSLFYFVVYLFIFHC